MIEEYMIWIWVGIFLILFALMIYTKSFVPFSFGLANLLTIIVNLAFPIKYYFEILIFILLGLLFSLIFYLLKRYGFTKIK